MNRIVSVLAALALTACNNSPNVPAAEKASNEISNDVQTNEPPSIPPPETGPDARTPLAEPQGVIDPKSAEAAGQVVQHYGALIEQKRWTEANVLWGDSASATKFAAGLAQYAEAHLEIGNP